MIGYREPRRFTTFNWVGFQTLYIKEVKRFTNIWTQTLLGPAVTNLLYFIVFSLALKQANSTAHQGDMQLFLAPGIIIMTIANNSFVSVSSAIMVSKVQGNIVDFLMPPINHLEMALGMLLSGITRGLCVGFCCWLPLIFIAPIWPQQIIFVFVFSVLGSVLMGSLGLIGAIWAQKFDHLNAFSNFLITPLIFLSGTFYSIQNLPPTLQFISHFNPFFYMIDGFRYGFLGTSDTSIWLSTLFLLGIDSILFSLVVFLLYKGWKLKH